MRIKKQTMIKEACVESFEEAKRAEEQGADRIELCSHLELDGLSPSFELMKKVCAQLTIPVMAMARPRRGDFVFTDEEVALTKKDIDLAKGAGAYGVVIGLLTPTNEIDVKNTALLAAYAHPLEVTFHKAIDETPDLLISLKALMQIKGISRILTSGGKPTAIEGANTLKEMVNTSQGKPEIIVAGKVLDSNINEIKKLTGAHEFHGKKIVGTLT